MSLWEDALENCVVYTHVTERDGQGGTRQTWAPGDTFKAALVLITNSETNKAQAQTLTKRYRVYTHKDMTLHYHDVFKRGAQGYRVVTADTDTPRGASLDMRVVEAEPYEMKGEQK